MKRILTLLSLALIFLMADVSAVLASHAAGSDISWTYTGTPNTYIVRVKFYRDCNGITAPNSVNICYTSVSCGQSGQQTAPSISSSVLPNPPCVNNTINCSGGFGIEEWIYETTITLPAACTDWMFAFTECCRNAAITTLTNGAGYNLYVSAYLDNLNYPTDNSPQFTTIPYSSFCVGNPFYFDQQAFDIDGDSLVYSLVNPLDGFDCNTPGTNITAYANATAPNLPLGPTQPVFSNFPVTISTAGTIYFLPSIQQVAVIAVLCQEFEHITGILKGSVRRDIQINITNQCNYIVPAYIAGIGGAVGSGITASCGNFSFVVPFGTEFQCGSVVPSDFRVLDPFGFANPVVSVNPINCTNGKTDSIEVTVLHSLTNGTSYVWTKSGNDGNTLLSECGQSQPEDDSLKIIVNDNSVFVPAVDSIGCLFNQATVDLTENIFCFSVAADGSDLIMVDGGTGNQLPISNVYGYCGPGGDRSNQVLLIMNGQQSIAGPAYLIAQQGSDNNTIADDCGKFLNVGDTVAILYVNNTIPVALGSDQTICDNQVPFGLNSGYSAPAAFTWSLNGTPIANETNPSYSATASGTYSVLVYSSATCFGSDTIDLDVLTTPAPNLGSDVTFCQGGNIPLLDAGTAGNYDYSWFYNGNLIFLANSSTYQPPVTQYGTYVVMVGNNSTCFGNDTVSFFSVQPPVDVLADDVICAGDPLPVLDAGNPGAGSYQWSENGNPISGATSQTYTVTNGNIGTVTYSVAIQSGGVCNGNFNMDLTITAAPLVTISNQSICEGNAAPIFDAQNSGSSITYNWVDNTNTTVGTNQQFTPSQNSVGTYTYTVTVTSAGGCSSSDNFDYTVNASPSVSLYDEAICELDPPVTLDASNAGSGITYQWSNGGTGSTINVNTDGTYIVTVTNSNGCTATADAVLSVERQMEAPVVNCGPGNDAFKYIYTWTDVTGSTGYEISEDGGLTWITPNSVAGTPNTHATNAIILNLMVRGFGNGLCREGLTSEPVVCAPILPNIITANGDNKNDALTISNIEFFPNNVLTIFNRWGKEVYSKAKYNNKDNVLKGDDLPEGTYYVILDLGDGQDAITSTLTIAK